MLARVRAERSRYHELQTRLLLARLEHALGRPGEARSELQTVLGIVHDFPMPFIAWQAQALLARLLEEAGEHAEGRQALGESARLIDGIAQNVHDARLRAVFLGWHAVRAVLDRLGEPT